jgi:NIPSNAP
MAAPILVTGNQGRREGHRVHPKAPGGNMNRTLVALMALSLGFSGFALYAAKGDQKVDSRIFELRTYDCAAGKMEALKVRFRDHTCKIFEKHHMTVIGFWNPTDVQQAERKLIYLLAFPSLEAAAKSWKDLGADPEWKAVKAASEKGGKLVEKIESVYLSPTDYSPLK